MSFLAKIIRWFRVKHETISEPLQGTSERLPPYCASSSITDHNDRFLSDKNKRPEYEPDPLCPRTRCRYISVACGLIIIAISLTVMFGYLTDRTTWIQWGLTGPVMRFNTGLFAIIVGLGIIALGLAKPLIARVTGIVVTIGGTITLLQFPLHAEFGIDRLFFDNPYTEVPLAGSRMGFNSAVCYMLIGLAMIMASLSDRYAWRRFLAAIFASATLAIAVVANLGHLTSLTAGHGWGGSYGMAVQTAICFTLSGTWFVVASIGQGRRLTKWSPIIVGNMAIIGTIILWHALEYQDSERIRGIVKAQFDSLDGQTYTDLRHLNMALSRMAARWEAAGGTPEAAWRDDVKRYLHELPSLDGIAWIDKTMNLRWTVTARNDNRLFTTTIPHNTRLTELIRSSRKTHRVMACGMELERSLPAHTDVWLSLPLAPNDNDDGCLLVAIDIHRIMINILSHMSMEGQIITIYDGPNLLYTNANQDDKGNRALLQKSDLLFADDTWTLSVIPTDQWITQQRSWLPEMTLGAGLVLSILTMVVLQLAMTTRRNYQQIVRTNTLLADETQQRARTEHTLRETLIFQQAILDNASHSIISTSPDGIIKVFNGGAERMLGYKAEEMIGKCTPEIIHVPEEIVARAQELTHELGRPIKPGFEVFVAKQIADIQGQNEQEWTFVRKDGSHFPVLLSVTAIRDSQDQITGFIGIAMDITERKKWEAGLREAKEAAETANRTKSEFLAAMSHELRTPLNAIIGFSQGLIERIDRHPLNNHQKNRIEKIHFSGLHLLGLVNDILDIAKIESGQIDFRTSTFDVSNMFSEIHSVIVGLAREKPNISIEIDIAPNPPLITTDREKAKQILINLASNAVKFTQEGSVTLSAHVDSEQFIFSVADTGMGIAKEQLDQVFDRFYQIRQATQQSMKGTGLGLTICKQFAELIGGSLDVSSEPGKGSTFTLRLPRYVKIEDSNPSKSLPTAGAYPIFPETNVVPDTGHTSSNS